MVEGYASTSAKLQGSFKFSVGLKVSDARGLGANISKGDTKQFISRLRVKVHNKHSRRVCRTSAGGRTVNRLHRGTGFSLGISSFQIQERHRGGFEGCEAGVLIGAEG